MEYLKEPAREKMDPAKLGDRMAVTMCRLVPFGVGVGTFSLVLEPRSYQPGSMGNAAGNVRYRLTTLAEIPGECGG